MSYEPFFLDKFVYTSVEHCAQLTNTKISKRRVLTIVSFNQQIIITQHPNAFSQNIETAAIPWGSLRALKN